MFRLAHMLFVFVLAHLCSRSEAMEEWIGDEAAKDKIPNNLLPFFEQRSPQTGRYLCESLCLEKQCDSFAFSRSLKSCRLYRHPNLNKPLPELKDDSVDQHQMYFRLLFCPEGWISDRANQMCYKVGLNAVNRSEAWDICESQHRSELVRFTSVPQRDSLYAMLNQTHPDVDKFWNGIAQFSGRFWTRAIEGMSNRF